MRRALRGMRALGAALILVGALAAGAGAQEELKVFGYLTATEATPFAIEYNQPSFGIPATPTFELRFMHSAAEADSGPSSHALSSALWPGDIIGSAPPSLVYDQFIKPFVVQPLIDGAPSPLSDVLAEIDEGVAEGWREGFEDAPSYPIKAETLYPQGPEDQRTDLGAGIGMRSSAAERGAEAVTTASRAGFPGLVGADHMNSSAFSGIRDGVSVSEAVTTGQNVTLLGGIVSLEGFTSTLTAVSDGVEATLDGSLLINGLTLTYPNDSGGTETVELVRVDDDGVVIGGEGAFTWEDARSFFEEQLEPHGITIEVEEADQTLSGAMAEKAITGLSITMDSRALSAMREMLPDPVREWLTSPADSPIGPVYDELPPSLAGLVDSVVQLDQSLTLVLGTVSVSSAASPPFELPPPPEPPVLNPPAVAPPAIAPPLPAPAGPQAPPVPETSSQFVAAVGVDGVPVALGIVGLFIALFGAAGLRLFADKATASFVIPSDRG